MAKTKISQEQKKSLTNINNKKNIDPRLIPYDPVEELLDENFIGKAILECLKNNDAEGVIEVISIYLDTLEKSKFIDHAHIPKSTLYYSLKHKNPTIKTLAKIVHTSAILRAAK